jgi:hypothetical protein
MTATNLVTTIDNTSYSVKEGSFRYTGRIEERSRCRFTVRDDNGTFVFDKGQPVTVTDTIGGKVFSGYVNSQKEVKVAAQPLVWRSIDCIDNNVLADNKTADKNYTQQFSGIILADMARALKYQGVIANFAIDSDTEQQDFASGNLNGTYATPAGNLELAPSGTTVTVTESTTSHFSSGSLTNTTASSSTLAPSATSSIKIVATQSVAAIANSYTYVKIWAGSPITIISGRYLAYDLWIDSNCPEPKIGMDLHFTDGTALRDLGTGTDAQFKLPHPGTDLGGLANTGKWYHRKFLLDNVAGKVIDYVTIACEGDKTGTYTGYVKNVFYVDVSDSVINTFFGGSLTMTPQQVQKQGYSTTKVSVVSTYDCSNSTRVSNAYSLSNAGILKSSFLTWKSTLPTSTDLLLYYSLDGGNSFTQCANNAALPNLPAGLSLSGKSIIFKEQFIQNTDADASAKPILNSVQLVINPSYTSSKTDVTFSASTNAEWNAGTLSNTSVNGNVLQILGASRDWDDGIITNQTLFAGGATGPNSVNSTTHTANNKEYSMITHQSTQGWSRFDFAGQWANFTAVIDNYVDNGLMKNGLEYRTTSTSNYDAQYAYAIEIFGTTIALQRGSNSNTAANGTRTQVAIATVNLTSQATHTIKVIVNGSSHQVYFDDTLAINATDSTYTAAGYMGVRVSNTDTVNGYVSRWDNFGVTVTGLSGTWTSANTSIAGATTYGGSVLSWDESLSDPTNNTILVEASLNNGGSYAACTNGGTIPGLTVGQSLSGVSVKFRITLSTTTPSALPQLRYFVARVLGQFSSSGTRISPALDLSNAGYAGSTVLSWNADTPASTSVAGATSLDGTSFTTVSSGGAISGITGQPDATLDTFDTLSGGNYLSTARTGGTAVIFGWDTANSRMAVSGGTNALLLNTSISRKDVDLMLDLDKADCSGLIWRRTDNSNFYELDIFDASSNAGATNKLRLYKVVANVKTQIGTDISISFTRNDKRRIRLIMIGTAINVYYDGTNVRSTTDSSLSLAGLSGLINVSGAAQFYNFRIQPIGDNLAGVKAYSKMTLSSTDPLSTPQVQDLTLAALSPNIELGSLISVGNYKRKPISNNAADLASKSNKYWNIDNDKNLIFAARQAIPAPWILQSNDQNLKITGPLTVNKSGDFYCNKVILTGVKDTTVVSEKKKGDNKSTSWALEYNVDSITSIKLNGQSKTVGVKGSTGYDFYYEVGSNSIAQDAAGTLLIETDELIFTYVGQFETEVIRNNTGQFAGTISQEDFANLSGIDDITFNLLNLPSSTQTASISFSDIDVSAFESISLDIAPTAKSGTSPTIQFFLERKASDGSYMTLWNSSIINAFPAPQIVSIGPGYAAPYNQSLGNIIRLRVAIAGTTPSWTFMASINGKLDLEAAGVGVVESVEDVSEQGLDVNGAEDYGDAKLAEFGVLGKTLSFQTTRPGLAPGQYLPVFIPEHDLWDEKMLVTSVELSQKISYDSGVPTQMYFYDIQADSGPNLGSWAKLLSKGIKGRAA